MFQQNLQCAVVLEERPGQFMQFMNASYIFIMILQNENFHEFYHLYGLAYARHISNIFAV